MPLFVYGTLCLPVVRDTLLRRPVPGRPAVLDRYEVRRISGRTYPTLVPPPHASPDGRVDGFLLDDLSDDDRRVLRAFEPPEYDLATVAVTVRGGAAAPGASDHTIHEIVEALVFVHRHAHGVTEEPWTHAGFTSEWLARFVAEVAEAADALWDSRPFVLDGSDTDFGPRTTFP